MFPQSGCRLCVGIVRSQNSGLWLPDTVPVDQTSVATRESTSHQSSGLAAALEALGPEDSTAKTEIQAALQSQGSFNTSTPSSVDSGCSEGGRMSVSRKLWKSCQIVLDQRSKG